MVLVRRNKSLQRDTGNFHGDAKGGSRGSVSLRDKKPHGFAVMLVGGNPLYQKGFKLILNVQSRAIGKEPFFLHSCSTVQNFEDKLRELPESQQKSVIIFLLDDGGEPASTIKKIDHLKKISPSCRILLSSGCRNVDYINRCIEKGVHAYVPLDVSEELLVSSVYLVAHGQMVIPSQIYHRKHEAASQRSGSSNKVNGNSPLSGIDDKEAKILGCLASGMPNKEISRLTGLSDPATKMAVRKVLGKIGAKNRVQAAVWAEKNGYSLDG